MAKNNWQDIDENYTATGDIPTEVAYKEYTTIDLWQEAWSKAGKALFYMQFLWPDARWAMQKNKVEKMCYHLAMEHRNHFKDTEENRKWFQQWIKEFDDETENMC